MKLKAKTEDGKLLVKATASFCECFNEPELKKFERLSIHGFLLPNKISRKQIIYSGPNGISLEERFHNPVTKRELLSIIENTVVAIREIDDSDLNINNVVFDTKNVYINNFTKEMHFIYVSLTSVNLDYRITNFFSDIAYSVRFDNKKDSEEMAKFISYLKTMAYFDGAKLEAYISKVDRTVVKSIRDKNLAQSGFMTDKPRDYYEHYNDNNHEVDDEATGLLVENDNYDEEATSLLNEDFDEAYKNAYGIDKVDEEATSLLNDDYQSYVDIDDEATGLLNEDNQYCNLANEQINDYDEEATGLLNDDYSDAYNDAYGFIDEEATPTNPIKEATVCNYEQNYDEEATGLLNNNYDYCSNKQNKDLATNYSNKYDDSNLTSLLGSDIEDDNYDDDGEEGTTLLVNNRSHVRFPELYRVITQELISINKPAFRIGKERSYVDYFVSNNSAVSRGHCDIITRGNNYFVVDLNSKNHTYINNREIPIKCEIEIHDGDSLRLGNEEFIFRE